MEMSEAVFGVKVKQSVIHQVFVSQTNNQREPWADTKSKGEVRGGGKKPWQQKGTGRARHGSIRSPIWKGGGVTFGPRTDRNYKTKINKQTKRLAIQMCLSDRAKNNAIWVAENFNFTEPKTKLFAAFVKALPVTQKSFLVLTSGKNSALMRMVKNIPRLLVMRAEDANVMEILKKQAIITSVDGIKKMEEVFGKK